ncbi:RICIN domain-containing protein [Geitlerinema splendidum]|nr:RICIN domain-containing protein [Geitlerinema splendidum]
MIIPGDFNGDGKTDLLFYDRDTGEHEFYRVNSNGSMTRIRRDTGWRTTWDIVTSLGDRQGTYHLKPGSGDLEFRKGQQWVTSTGYKFIFQNDGNLVLYNPQGRAIWATDDIGIRADRFVVQKDGNVVLYDGRHQIWATNTSGHPGAYLAIQGDGNLVVYSSSDKVLFSTGTQGGREGTRMASREWLRNRNFQRFPRLHYSTIISKATGQPKAMDGGGNNSSVYLHSSLHPNGFRQWGFEKVGDYYMIINKETGKALDGGGINGKLPYTHPDPQRNNPNQLWELRKVGEAYMIINKATGYALDADGEIYMHRNPAPDKDFQLWELNLPNTPSNNILERAKVWVDQQISYSQVKFYQGYRQDCSGFVSMAWQLPVSAVTSTLPQYAITLNNKNQLQPGDAINNRGIGNGGHVVLFVRWVDQAKGTFIAYEQNGGHRKAVQTQLTLKSDATGYYIEQYPNISKPWYLERKKS